MQSFAGRQHSIVNQALIRFRDLRNHTAVGRIHVGEIPLPSHELTVDVVQDGLQLARTPPHRNSLRRDEATS